MLDKYIPLVGFHFQAHASPPHLDYNLQEGSFVTHTHTHTNTQTHSISTMSGTRTAQ